MADSCYGSTVPALLFACAGGANVGQMANDAAVKLEQSGAGRLYCLAGVGGHIEGMVKTARSAPCTVAIDGCAAACARKTLEQAGIEPTICITVTELGIKKEHTYQYPEEDVQRVVDAVLHGTEAAGAAEPSAASCCGAGGANAPGDCCSE